jgi:hypothetical protein
MAKKQTRRSISVSRTTYEKLKAFCETNNISMSQFVESGISERLGTEPAAPIAPRPMAPRPMPSSMASFERATQQPRQEAARPAPAPAPTRPAITPMTSAAARFAVEPPPPIIKPRVTEQQPKPPAEPTAGQIFTF